MKANTSLIAMLILLIPVIGYSQVVEGFPLDENGHINYNDVVKVDSVKANELYLRAKQAFVDIFKSGKDVIQLDDKESAVIIGKGFSDISLRGTPFQMWYTIKIASKDGRYKYEIYDIIFKSYPNSIYPNGNTSSAETVFDKKTYYKGNGKPRDIMEVYKTNMESNVNSLALSIKAGMNKSVSGSKKDDW